MKLIVRNLIVDEPTVYKRTVNRKGKELEVYYSHGGQEDDGQDFGEQNRTQ